VPHGVQSDDARARKPLGHRARYEAGPRSAVDHPPDLVTDEQRGAVQRFGERDTVVGAVKTDYAMVVAREQATEDEHDEAAHDPGLRHRGPQKQRNLRRGEQDPAEEPGDAIHGSSRNHHATAKEA
jgi:hypothetical protein